MENYKLEEVREMPPHNHSNKPYIAGRQHELAGNFDQARACYCQAVCLNPDNPHFIRAAANLARHMGNAEDAKALFQEALACAGIGPGSPNARFTSLVCGARGI